MEINYRKIGSRIAQRRKELGLNQERLSEILHVSNNHLSHVENGGSYSLDMFLRVCDALEITPDYIILGAIRKDRREDFLDMLKLCDDHEAAFLLDVTESLIKNRKS